MDAEKLLLETILILSVNTKAVDGAIPMKPFDMSVNDEM